MRYLSFALLLLFTIGCAPSNSELASKLLIEANILKDKKEYNRSKILLDSINSTYPDEQEVCIRASHLVNAISILEQQRIIQLSDSALKEKEATIKPLLLNFKRDVDSGDDTLLIHIRQLPQNSYNRSYIRANLNTKGDFYLSSQYVGESNINHTQMRAVCGSSVALSVEIKEDGSYNRHFEDEDVKWEIIQFKNNGDNGISDLIAKHYNEGIRVDLIGGNPYSIYLEEYDKEAIRDGYEISFLLKEIALLKETIKRSQRVVEKLSKAK